MTASKKGIEIQEVSKTFTLEGKSIPALGHINISIRSGEFVSIVGKSGCGKSTLLRIISGLENASTGQVLIGDRRVERASVMTGLVFQEPRLFPWLTVAQNIEFGIHGELSRDERRQAVSQHIDLVGLNGFAKAYPRQLSGGMQQRVSIARSLINKPGVLLLDEPFGALDALTRINMQNEVLRIWQSYDATMALVTHDVDEAIFLSDRIFVMSERPGTISKVIDVDIPRPRERSGARFMEIRREIFTMFFTNSAISIEYYI
jgi:sulfonate transport system ATP-binding protein